MMWMDSDTMCSKAWEQDPIAAMVRNDLVLMYDNYPQVSFVLLFTCVVAACLRNMILIASSSSVLLHTGRGLRGGG